MWVGGWVGGWERSMYRWNCLPRAVAIERPREVLPTPGGPTKQRMGPFRERVSARTAMYSRMRRLTCVQRDMGVSKRLLTPPPTHLPMSTKVTHPNCLLSLHPPTHLSQSIMILIQLGLQRRHVKGRRVQTRTLAFFVFLLLLLPPFSFPFFFQHPRKVKNPLQIRADDSVFGLGRLHADWVGGWVGG